MCCRMHAHETSQTILYSTVGHVAVHFICTDTHLLHISLLWGPVFTYVSELINDHSETNVLHLGVLHRKPCRAPSFTMCIKSKSMLYTFYANVY